MRAPVKARYMHMLLQGPAKGDTPSPGIRSHRCERHAGQREPGPLALPGEYTDFNGTERAENRGGAPQPVQPHPLSTL